MYKKCQTFVPNDDQLNISIGYNSTKRPYVPQSIELSPSGQFILVINISKYNPNLCWTS